MTRKYLNEEEIRCLLQTISNKVGSERDYCMVCIAFLHGLRVSELTSLMLEDYDPLSKKLSIKRLKGGFSTCHPLLLEEDAVLQLWLIQRKLNSGSHLPWLFLTRQGGKMTRQRFYQILRKYGHVAGLPLSIHPHMLRHSCGYSLAERGIDTRLIQDYLGHRNIRHTVLYTASNAQRFKNIWSDKNNVKTIFTLTSCF
ncbi:tyrosine-type recombinase/integrase [Kosakonia oryziphila]|uniref:Type 1 fimbriae regulatory protein FimB n=1 Tax=Kosakonia oryziphila TaxID=1005667 RepID=A0A1C4GQK8_9ENTR|nr:tyrosine-type recombinase/integrase [Kosakonia oryziphila]SCC70153.1 type 1 fimbriae regulatory protein FimB [Kosakonia oryziphila]